MQQLPGVIQPSLIGSEECPIQLLTSILFPNIVLSCGSTMLPGLGDRLLYEVRNRAPERMKIRISLLSESACVGDIGEFGNV